MICRVAWRVVTGGGATDERSDEEGDEFVLAALVHRAWLTVLLLAGASRKRSRVHSLLIS
jgi:hypothetical protein